jgi:NAD(P)-dependent dehydrogenase (short-subunit alcohol dehydrogenase family)
MHDRKTAITGASTGIGRAIAVALAKNGWDIALTHLGGGKDAAEVEGLGPRPRPWPRRDRQGAVRAADGRRGWRFFAGGAITASPTTISFGKDIRQ